MAASHENTTGTAGGMLARVRIAARIHPDVRAAFALSAVAVLIPAVIVSLQFTPSSDFDYAPETTHPFGGWPLGGLLNAAFSSLARWDAVHYLAIANDGYVMRDVAVPTEPRAAFYPAYPLLARLAGLGGLSHATVLLGAYAVSGVAFLGALEVIHRLARLEIGPEGARRAVLLVSLFPTAFFFFAPYSESLFLLCAAASIYAARTDRWALAAAVAAGAAATRLIGLTLVVPLLMLFVSQHRDRTVSGLRSWVGAVRRRLLWLALIPLPLLLFSLWLAQSRGDALAWFHAQQGSAADRSFLPLRGVADAWSIVSPWLESAVTSTGSLPPMDRHVVEFWFLLIAVVGVVGVLRRLPLPYGAYVLASLAVPLSAPPAGLPLIGIPRYFAVLFPIMLWAALGLRGRRFGLVLAVSSALLVMLTAQFATWGWVA